MMAGRWENTALLVIDMQMDDIEAGSVMQVKGRESIVPTVKTVVDLAWERKFLVFWIDQRRDPQRREIEVACRRGPSVGAELIDGLKSGQDYEMGKCHFSAFFGTDLHGVLQCREITNLVIVGVETPNDIRQTAFDAVQHDYTSVTVISDATAAATPEIHNANILDMRNIGVKTPTLHEWSK